MNSHTETPATGVEQFTLDFERRGGGSLWLRYHVDLPLDSLALPDPATPDRANVLWQTTCFELFLRRPGAGDYVEFNFSPSSRWAAYHFEDYRSGRSDLQLPAVPEIGLDASESHFALEVELALPSDLAASALELKPTAIIEEKEGTKSYWALAHPPGDPDFHHHDCFTLTLPAPDAA